MTERIDCPEPARRQALLEGYHAEDAQNGLAAYLEACPQSQHRTVLWAGSPWGSAPPRRPGPDRPTVETEI